MQEFEAELKQASSDDEKSTLDASAKAGEGESVRNVECALFTCLGGGSNLLLPGSPCPQAKY